MIGDAIRDRQRRPVRERGGLGTAGFVHL